MSKRKKSYNRVYDCNYGLNNDSNQCLMYQDNLYKMFNTLGNMDFRNLINIISLISDGFDINDIKLDKFNYENINNGTYINENVINFFVALKPILGIEIGNIIDKFIEFYMNEINNEENR